MIIFWNGYICNRKFFNCYIWNEWTIFINLMCWTTIAFLGSSLFYPDYSLLFSLQGRRAAGAEETETVAVTGVAVPLPFLPLLPTANDDEGGGGGRGTSEGGGICGCCDMIRWERCSICGIYIFILACAIYGWLDDISAGDPFLLTCAIFIFQMEY